MIEKKPGLHVAPIVGAVFLAVVAFGCGAGGENTTSDQAPGSSATAVEEIAPEPVAHHAIEVAELMGAWLLEDLGGRGVADGVETTVVFDSEGRVSGSGGCNRYTGSYNLENGLLSFGPIAGTKMMCPEAVMNQEDGFLRALGDAGRVEMDGSILMITIEGWDKPLRFTPLEPEVTD